MKERAVEMSPLERAAQRILVVEPDALDRNHLRTTLKALGFGTVTDAPSHHASLEKFDVADLPMLFLTPKNRTIR